MESLKNKVPHILLYIIPSIIAVIFIILFINTINNLNQAEKSYKDRIEKHNQEKKELIAGYKEKEKLFKISENLKINNIALLEYFIEEMKRKGLTNPVENIISDLQKHPELIPYEGTLGGTMGFYFKKEIWVLNNKWVFAYFEDGHTGGYLLLEYIVSDEGKISWERIASMMD